MSHALTIEPSSIVSGGFKQETPDISGIKEGANISGTLLNKLGTSIPTPFARLHLFNSAFKEVNAIGIGLAGSNYQKLVSLALDMLEFLYLYGASSELTVLRWNVDQQTKALKQSSNDGHKLLGEALEAAWKDGNYGVQDLYLFKYRNEIVGGTSPLSLFYTNPNLKKTFPGLSNNHKLFDPNDPVDLSKRDKEFRLFLYKLYNLYSSQFQGTEIGQYISNQMIGDREDNPDIDNAVSDFAAMAKSAMEQEMKNGQIGKQPYIVLTLNNAPLFVGKGIKLWVKDLSNISFVSDYKIKPSVNTFEDFEYNGAPQKLRTPLVLNEYGINSAKYINNTQWTAGNLPLSDLTVPLHLRKLPNSEVIYPYLRAEDFFQDHIIELSYNIQKDKFFTGLKEDTTFLLPLKQEFFKYFKPEDLEEMFKVEVSYTPDLQADTVKVTLLIPLENGEVLPLEKIYSAEAKTIVDAKPTVNTFNLSFFPFFRDEAEGVKNEYDVMLVSSIESARLNFYNLSQPDRKYDPIQNNVNGQIGEIVSNIRTAKGGNNTSQTIHYHINRPFDIVEVTLENGNDTVSGFILPKFRKLDTSNPTSEYVFGVDFGTTNTQIAFACNNGTIETFYIRLDEKDEELQTIYLNNHSKTGDGKHLIEAGFGSFSDIASMSRREFVTSEMGNNLFPIRTAICEMSSLNTVQEPRLFGNLNIGFNYTTELTSGTGANRYVTDLKWDTSDIHGANRMKTFFQETLLIMRNKSILNGGYREIKVAVTYPQAMNGRVENDFKKAWKDAATEIGLNPDNIKFHFESIAPYYSFSRQMGLIDTYVNMDIGGGSTDILYFDPKSNEKMTFSVMFAGNDIWGDGCNPLLEGGRNGFIKQYEASTRFKNLPEDSKNRYKAVKRNSSRGSGETISQRSSDIINYLFKNDKEYHFTDAVKDSNLILLPLLHFTSLIYYLGHISESQDLNLPRTLSFTGMGSLYLKMLGSQEQLSHLAQQIIRVQSKKTSPTIQIIFAENPKKVTAEGAVTISLAHSRGIELISTETGLCFGIQDEEPDTKLKIANVMDAQVAGQPLDEIIINKGNEMGLYGEIVEMMIKDEEYRDAISNMGFDNALNALPSKEDMLGIFRESLSTCIQNFKKDHKMEQPTNKLKESLFFWPLKNGLYMLGEKLTQGLNQNIG